MAEQSEKNDPMFKLDDKLHRINKQIFERAIKADAEAFTTFNKGKGKGKDGGKGKDDVKGSGKAWSKGTHSKGQKKGGGKQDNRHHSWNYDDNRGEKRTLPWDKAHYENKKGKKGSGHSNKNDASHRTCT